MKRLALLLILFAVSSCVYDYKVPDVKGSEDALVIDGSIIVGAKATLEASRLSPVEKRVHNEPVNPSSWWVEDDAGGRYDSGADGTVNLAAASSDRAYRMVIVVDGLTYTSSFQKPLPAPQIKDLSFTLEEPMVKCNISFALDPASGSYVDLTFEEIWEFHADFMQNFIVQTQSEAGEDPGMNLGDGNNTENPGEAPDETPDETPDEDPDEGEEPEEEEEPEILIVTELQHPITTYYYCWTQKKSTATTLVDLSPLNGKAEDYTIHQFQNVNNRNHRNYNIKVWARTISEREYRFHTALAEQDGGLNLFTPNPGEIPGNIVCEEDPSKYVYGYVSTSSSVSMEAHLDSRYHVPSNLNTSGFIAVEPDYYADYLSRGFWPIMRDSENNILWGLERCVNCVAAGGTLEKPEFSQ